MTQRVEYDPATETSVTWTQTFNAENRLATVSDGTDTWTFLYDGDGNRVKQIQADGTVTLFLAGGSYEVEDASGSPSVTHYYAIAGQRVATSALAAQTQVCAMPRASSICSRIISARSRRSSMRRGRCSAGSAICPLGRRASTPASARRISHFAKRSVAPPWGPGSARPGRGGVDGLQGALLLQNQNRRGNAAVHGGRVITILQVEKVSFHQVDYPILASR